MTDRERAPGPAAGAAATETARATVPVMPVAAPAPFDPEGALAGVVAGASAERSVKVTAGKPRLRINHDRMTFSDTSSHAGYIYVHMLGTAPHNMGNYFCY